MNIKGSYVIRAGNKIIRGNNIITLLGESFFMNRAINNEFDPLKYIVFGNSSIITGRKRKWPFWFNTRWKFGFFFEYFR